MNIDFLAKTQNFESLEPIIAGNSMTRIVAGKTKINPSNGNGW